MTEWIKDRCPSCGSRGTMFIGAGGYLTCSLKECPEPVVGASIQRLIEDKKTLYQIAKEALGIIVAWQIDWDEMASNLDYHPEMNTATKLLLDRIKSFE